MKELGWLFGSGAEIPVYEGLFGVHEKQGPCHEKGFWKRGAGWEALTEMSLFQSLKG